jgi:hypothetical protein
VVSGGAPALKADTWHAGIAPNALKPVAEDWFDAGNLQMLYIQD